MYNTQYRKQNISYSKQLILYMYIYICIYIHLKHVVSYVKELQLISGTNQPMSFGLLFSRPINILLNCSLFVVRWSRSKDTADNRQRATQKYRKHVLCRLSSTQSIRNQYAIISVSISICLSLSLYIYEYIDRQTHLILRHNLMLGPNLILGPYLILGSNHNLDPTSFSGPALFWDPPFV